MMIRPISSLAAVTLVLGGAACREAPPPVTIFAASSLATLLDAARRQWPLTDPDSGQPVAVQIELSASRLACAKVSDQDRRADLVLSADVELIDEMLRPAHAPFTLVFAANRLVLAYRAQGAVAAALAAGHPWQEVLDQPAMRIGIANPALAPVGYRALLALRLNDRHAPPALRRGAAIAARLHPAQQRSDVGQLLAPLQSGELDAAFLYASDVHQQGLASTSLGPALDFSDPDAAASYAQATLSLPALGAFPARTVHGTPALYALTIPDNAPRRALAVILIRHLLSSEGRALAARAHLPLLPPAALRLSGDAPPALVELIAAADRGE